TGTAANASLEVGGVGGTGFMTMTGASTVNVGATGSATVGSTAGSNGTLTVGGGSSVTANVIGIGGNSDSAAGGDGTAVVTGAGSTLNANGANAFLSVGRGGSGSLSVSDGGALNATIVSVGRADGGFGTLTVDAAAINLSGQQTAGSLSGAALTIGSLGGTGLATIRNGSVVTISNPGSAGVSFNVGGTPVSPGGSGVLNVSNSQVNLTAAPGQATVRIGHDGNGIATFTGSTMNVGNPTASGADGVLVVAGQPGSTGTLTLNNAGEVRTVVNAGYVGVGATQSGPGGTGTLTLNNSTLNTTTFELGARGLLSGDGGVINASGDVIIGGTISPGNSPGRVTIDCNLITLPGSMLILDILGSGADFAVDHLRIGNDSTFDLHALHIVFNFLGSTDPNAFAASGGFNLDNFLQSLDLATGAVTGLSSVFASDQTWADIVNPAGITAVSSAYDISDLRLQPDGTVNVVAAPVPEPSTWAMLALGLMALSGMARRRALARRR
ncbi:MAG: PEP-CTERM sorting domain-containing protein, partial [Caldimonas sp.]